MITFITFNIDAIHRPKNSSLIFEADYSQDQHNLFSQRNNQPKPKPIVS